jgi:hypothetical protein
MLERNYAANAKEFHNIYNTLQRALKQQIIKTFDALWLQGIEDDVVAFSYVTARQMMVSIYNSYGGIRQSDLVDNNNKRSEPFYPAQPIKRRHNTGGTSSTMTVMCQHKQPTSQPQNAFGTASYPRWMQNICGST